MALGPQRHETGYTDSIRISPKGVADFNQLAIWGSLLLRCTVGGGTWAANQKCPQHRSFPPEPTTRHFVIAIRELVSQ